MRIPSTLGIVLLAGCAVGPDYERPEPATPGEWGEPAGGRIDAGSADLARWWTVFGDARLDALVGEALRANHDLRIASARVKEARARVGIAQAPLLPSVTAAGSYTRRHESENAFRFPGADLTNSFYGAGFETAWEIDLFGGTRRALEAARADFGSTTEGERAVRVALLGEVARHYVAVRGQQRLRAVLRANADGARATVELVRARLQAGVATDFDLARAEAERAANESLLPPVETALRESIHRLGVLLGRGPQALLGELSAEAPIPVAPARVVVGLPADLIARRPDVRGAERALAAATARIGVATAELFPKISLTGAFGLDSLGAHDFFETASRAWSVGPSIRWPLFSAGRIRAGIRVADAQQEQALAVYEQSVLRALEEVENAIVAYLREWDRHRSLAAAAAAHRRAVQLADDLYRQGLASFLDVLEAQRALHSAEAELARGDAAVTLDLVTLFKVLGGGWPVEGR